MKLCAAAGVLVLVASLSCTSFGYPNSVPTSACISMVPQHQAEAQNSLPPYRITVKPDTYSPGSGTAVSVTLTSPQPFKGVLVEARSAVNCSNTKPVGTFLLSLQEADLQLLNCSAPGDAVTHKNPNPKSTMVFLWNPPARSMGPVYIRATVVQSKTMFWTTVASPVLRDATEVNAPRLTEPVCLSPQGATTAHSLPQTTAAATSPFLSLASTIYVLIQLMLVF